MRCLETKEQSSELLRLALPLMARQFAAHHPVSYALWYEHVAGMNPALTTELTARLDANALLTDTDVYRLHARYISARDIEALECLQQQLRTLLEEAAEVAASAGEETGQLSQTLEESRVALVAAVSLESMQQVIGRLLTETMRLHASTRELSKLLRARAEEVRQLSAQLERAQTEALVDPLCGLKNRRGFELAVQSLFEHGLQDAALLVADVDHFKLVNDSYGHLLGDKVLRCVGQVLQANIKGRDIAARIGGEEFAILLPQTTLRGAQAVAEQIRSAVAAGRLRHGDAKKTIGSVTLSIGLALAQAGESFEGLMARADAALYNAKREGRNCVRVAAAG